MDVQVEELTWIKPPLPKERTTLYLNNLEQQLFFPIETLFIFSHPTQPPESIPNVTDVIREAIRAALVPFHFVAGRIAVNEVQRRVELDCNTEGVLYATATCRSSLQENGELRQPDPSFRKMFIYPPVSTISDVPLATIQVTKFSCGGFVVGIYSSHGILDGASAHEFYDAIARAARGEELTVNPNPNRTSLRPRVPPQPSLEHPELVPMPDIPAKLMFDPAVYDPNYPVVPPGFTFRIFPFTTTMLNKLKSAAVEDGTLSKCTTFEALTAHIWRARTKAMNHRDTSKAEKLFVVVDPRHKLKNPPLPEHFSGVVAIAPGCVETTARQVTEEPFSFCVKKVQETIQAGTEEYLRSTIDWFELRHGCTNLHDGMLVTAWSKLPFHEIDFGWGKPSYVASAVHNRPWFVTLLSNCKGDGGIDVFVAMDHEKVDKLEESLYNIHVS